MAQSFNQLRKEYKMTARIIKQARIHEGESEIYIVIPKDSQAPVLLLEWIADYTCRKCPVTVHRITDDVENDELYIRLGGITHISELYELKEYINNNLPVS